MKCTSSLHRKLLAAGFTTLSLFGYIANANAGAYQLSREYNAVELGNSGAGGAAIATDASTAYANPAGLIRIPKIQLVISGDGIFTDSVFRGSNTWTNSAAPPGVTFTQTGSAKTSDRIFVPAFFLNVPINNKWSFGFGTSVPYGLSTNYGNNSILRYSATISKIEVIDVSPDLAYKFNNQWSAGIGADFEQVSVDFRRVIGNPSPFTAGSISLDSLGKNTVSGWGYGGHAGILYQMRPETRFGIAYHSRVSTSLSGGNSSLSGLLVAGAGVPSGLISTNNLRTTLILPPSTVVSAHHDFNSAWAIDASVYYTQWKALSSQQVTYNLAGLPPTTPITGVIPQNYKNTWLLALGGTYQISPTWMLRAGAHYDQTPVQNYQRNVTIPDANRMGLSIGAHVDVTKQLSFDGGWMHLFIADANVGAPLTLGTQTSVANGSFTNASVDLVGLQMNLNLT